MSTEELVPVQPFAEAFQSSGLSAIEFAERMGYLRNYKCKKRKGLSGDGTRAMRVLGLKDEVSKHHHSGRRQHVRYDMAVRLCKALDLDPVDFGV